MRHRSLVTAGLVLTLVGTTMGFAHAASVHATIATPVLGSYYDGHTDAIVITDSSRRLSAHVRAVNYAPGLARLRPHQFPKIFWVRGDAAMDQLLVLGSEPGESSYSPVWRQIDVRWKNGVMPRLLTSDTEVDAARKAGDLTTTPRDLLVNAPVIANDVADPSAVTPPKVFMTFYDGHKDGMLATDVSNKAQAKARGINFAKQLGTVDPSSFPEIYIVRGKHAAGQLNVLGSEPGESSYSPLWLETNVRWVKGVTPKVIKSDTQIDALEAMGKLVEHGTNIVLDCPVVSTP